MEDMKLSPENQVKIKDWLDIHWKKPRVCDLCRNTSWFISDKLATLNTADTAGNFVLGSGSFPLVVLVCTSCGNSKFVNAVVLGLMPDPEGEGSR